MVANRFKKIKTELVKKYYEWRRYRYILRNIKPHSKLNTQTEEHVIPYINKPGICFSFDDSFRVNDWHTYAKDIFGYYDVKATFNINAFHHFENQREHNQQEIDKLLELQSNGHEIAHHSYSHKDAAKYSYEVGLNRWIEDEITSLFDWVKKQSHSLTKEKFKNPVTFAFPYFRYSNENVKELVPKYFKIVRGHLKDSILVPFNYTGLAPSIGIDSNLLTNTKYIKKIIKIAKRSGHNLIFTCHSVLPKEVSWEEFGWGEEAQKAGNWKITPDTIKKIINEARNNDLEFYTTAELAGVATFIDLNFEKYVRGLISNPSAKWISISELCLIKELDLGAEKITNLDGIQYFLNLERINLNTLIKDFRLLERLPKLKKIEIIDLKEKEALIYKAK